ncbi:MAG: hypothetical protein WCG27_09055, partial [Pseudomonadota bacterium]
MRTLTTITTIIFLWGITLQTFAVMDENSCPALLLTDPPVYHLQPNYEYEHFGQAAAWSPYPQIVHKPVIYWDARQRQGHLLTFHDGAFYQGPTRLESKDGPVTKIFVMDPQKNIYVGDEEYQRFHNSTPVSG